MDRLINEDSLGTISIVTEGTVIKQIVRDHFDKWTRKRNTNVSLAEKWSTFYKPIPTINQTWYDNLLKDVDLDELMTIISSLPNKKAPGQSNLQYEWFKHLPMV